MIKITITKEHRVGNSGDNKTGLSTNVSHRHVPVAEGKLVLIGRTQNTFDSDLKEIYNESTFKPIIISEIEKIEVGDKIFCRVPFSKESIEEVDFIMGEQIHCKSGLITESKYSYKIIALPEHFSLEQLQMIVDGKLKEGKVLVECENKYIEPSIDIHSNRGHFENQIKLNSSNHITLHKVEEKMVSESTVINFLKWKERDHGHKFDTELDAWNWFEQNVK